MERREGRSEGGKEGKKEGREGGKKKKMEGGREEGKNKGREEGREGGREEGRKEGRKKEREGGRRKEGRKGREGGREIIPLDISSPGYKPLQNPLRSCISPWLISGALRYLSCSMPCLDKQLIKTHNQRNKT